MCVFSFTFVLVVKFKFSCNNFNSPFCLFVAFCSSAYVLFDPMKWLAMDNAFYGFVLFDLNGFICFFNSVISTLLVLFSLFIPSTLFFCFLFLELQLQTDIQFRGVVFKGVPSSINVF